MWPYDNDTYEIEKREGRCPRCGGKSIAHSEDGERVMSETCAKRKAIFNLMPKKLAKD